MQVPENCNFSKQRIYYWNHRKIITLNAALGSPKVHTNILRHWTSKTIKILLCFFREYLIAFLTRCYTDKNRYLQLNFGQPEFEIKFLCKTINAATFMKNMRFSYQQLNAGFILYLSTKEQPPDTRN